MPPTLLRFVWRFSKRQQAIVCLLTLMTLPFYYLSLELPKVVINEVIGREDMDARLFGLSLGQFEQITWLVILCVVFLAAVSAQGAIKYCLNVYKGRLGGRLLLELRRLLCIRLLDMPESRVASISSDELGTLIGAELTEVGSFMGDALALPMLQGGLLLTGIGFIFVQDPWLGIAAVALFPVQGFVIPRLQRQVNALNRERAIAMRRLSARLGESIESLDEIRAIGAGREEFAALDRILIRIFEIRHAIFRRRSFIKLLNNFLFQLTPFLFLLIGGYLVIRGQFTLGALAAVLVAYKDLPPPARELFDYYQVFQEVKLRYEQVVSEFEAGEPAIASRPDDEGREESPAHGTLQVAGAGIMHANRLVLDDVTFDAAPGQHLALLGLSRLEGDRLARVLAGLERPAHGAVRIGEYDAAALPAPLRSRLALLNETPALFNQSVRDNLFYGQPETAPSRSDERAVQALEHVLMGDDLPRLGLGTILNLRCEADLAWHLVKARAMVHERLTAGERARIESFDITRFCAHASIAENLIWGQPLDSRLDLDNLGEHRSVAAAIERRKLAGALLRLGIQAARVVVERYAAGEPVPGAEDGRRVIYRDELDTVETVLMHEDARKPGRLSSHEQRLLHSIALRLIPARHDFCVIGEDLREGIVALRKPLSTLLSKGPSPLIAPFDPGAYNPGLTVGGNLLFGVLIDDRPAGAARIESHLVDILGDLGLVDEVTRLGLDFEIGNGGRRLTPSQRQRLGLARAWLREPALTIACRATSELEPETEERVVERFVEASRGRGLVWILDREQLAGLFDRALVLSGGRPVAQGTRAERLPRD